MHFIVSWDIATVEPRWSQINRQMQQCFNGHPQIRPVNTYYIIKVDSQDQYNTINTNLQKVAKAQAETVIFISTPLLLFKDGYIGLLADWAKVNEITG
jgi:hypothetical protein